MEIQHSELMDLTKVAKTLPSLGKPSIKRENMVMTLIEMLETEAEVVIVEGQDGIGKTTLLAQFFQEKPDHTFGLFIRPSSRWAYDSGMLTKDLSDQIGWALSKEDYRANKNLEAGQLLRTRIFDLHKQANYERTTYYFIIDGLNEIPEEDSHEREMILKLLPFGLSCFKFILSGPLDSLKIGQSNIGLMNIFRLPGFTFEETREFFKDIVEDRTALETIHKVSKMVPGNLSSIRRLLKSGTTIDQLLQELPDRLPDLFELEWRVVEADDVLLRQAIAILAFDRRLHSINSLARLCQTDPDIMENKISSCNFIERRNGEQVLEFVCEIFKNFVSRQLSNLRRNTIDIIISDLLSSPESDDAVTHLPSFLHQNERYEDLLNYLSPNHIGRLIDCGDSWIPLHQKASLGVDTAFQMHRDGDLLRFGLQRATISSMESSEPWRSEIEAYVAIDDFSAAYALVKRMITKEDRLHLLAVIARAKKKKSLPIEEGLRDQIQQLYKLVDKKSLGDRGMEIATDLLYTHPELAIELVQECMKQEGSEDRSDFALVELSFKALTDRESCSGMESTYQALREKVKNPKAQKFVDTISIFFGGYSAEGVIAEVEKWDNAIDRIFALQTWSTSNAKRADAFLVVEFALNTIIKTTTYTANAKVYHELAIPLLYMTNKALAKTIIGRLDSLKSVIESAGPTEEYVKLQATLCQAEAKYDKQVAFDRLLDLFFYVDSLTDPSTKLASFAILARILKAIDPEKQYESQGGIHKEVVDGLKSVIDEILTKTADHFEAVRPAIKALARSDIKIAQEVIDNLNTAPRREAASVKFIETIALEIPSPGNFDTIDESYTKLRSVSMRAWATRVILKGLLRHKKAIHSFMPRIFGMQNMVKEIPNAQEKCQAYCMLLELLIENRALVLDTIFDSLSKELKAAWDTIDLGWAKVNAGFKIVSILSEGLPDLSREFLSQTEQARNEIVLDCPDTATSYISCVRLTLRCFGGMIKRKIYNNDDMEALHILISRIPAMSLRSNAWSELALKFYTEGDIVTCREIISERVLPILESNVIQDSEALWNAIISAAPALYSASNTSAKQVIDKIPSSYRDDAYGDICSFLIDKRLPTESYDPAYKPSEHITYSVFLEVYEVLLRLESDSMLYCNLESLIDNIEKRFKSEFSKVQVADIQQKLHDLVSNKFPNMDYIKHEGFKILAEAQIARLDRNSNPWNNLTLRARAIPNVADRSFVLMNVGTCMPAKKLSEAMILLQEAKSLIPQISTFEDRCDRLELLAKLSADIDKQMSKDCIRQAWSETMPQAPTELPKTRRRIIDFAYRLDPDFAAALASETDDDPGRSFARMKAKQRLEVLKMREKLSAGEEDTQREKQNIDQQAELAGMLLSGLNSNRINSYHIDFTRKYIKNASMMTVQNAYTVLSWVVENAVRRYSDTDQSKIFLRPLYEGARLSAELAFRIATRIRSVTDLGITAARTTEGADKNLIHAGEYDKAMIILMEWAASAEEFIKITDPYFGLEELKFVKLIRNVNVSIPIFILTSRKHQHDTHLQQPWDDTYQSHWRMAISDCDAGNVTIVVVGKDSTGEHPIHDRWWLSNKSGIRIGTSVNSLGVGKLSEISPISEDEVTDRLTIVDSYIAKEIRNYKAERIRYISFNL